MSNDTVVFGADQVLYESPELGRTYEGWVFECTDATVSMTKNNPRPMFILTYVLTEVDDPDDEMFLGWSFARYIVSGVPDADGNVAMADKNLLAYNICLHSNLTNAELTEHMKEHGQVLPSIFANKRIQVNYTLTEGKQVDESGNPYLNHKFDNMVFLEGNDFDF